MKKWITALLPVVVFYALGCGGGILIGGAAGLAVAMLVPLIGGAWTGLLLGRIAVQRLYGPR